MNEEEKQQAIKIMEKLIEHPITSLFHTFKPVENTDESTAPTTSSAGLLDIKANLLKSGISLTDWSSQITNCFTNSSNFTEKQSKYFPIISEECQKIFEKLFGHLKLKSTEKWCTTVSRLQTAQIELARHPPRKIFSIAIQLDSFKKIDNEKIIPLSLAEIKAFQQALTLIKSEDTSHGLVNIVTEMPPEIKTTKTNELSVELMKLDIKTVRAMREYLKVELEKQGDHYPT